jgi:hypothetical protein
MRQSCRRRRTRCDRSCLDGLRSHAGGSTTRSPSIDRQSSPSGFAVLTGVLERNTKHSKCYILFPQKKGLERGQP